LQWDEFIFSSSSSHHLSPISSWSGPILDYFLAQNWSLDLFAEADKHTAAVGLVSILRTEYSDVAYAKPSLREDLWQWYRDFTKCAVVPIMFRSGQVATWAEALEMGGKYVAGVDKWWEAGEEFPMPLVVFVGRKG